MLALESLGRRSLLELRFIQERQWRVELSWCRTRFGRPDGTGFLLLPDDKLVPGYQCLIID